MACWVLPYLSHACLNYFFAQDMGEMMMVQRANDLVKSAAQDVEMARQVLPSLPFTKEGALQAAQMGVFASMLLPGIGGNMMEQMMLQKSMNSVREMEQQVQECAQWVQRNLDAFSLDVNRMRATAAEKRAQAVALQRSMLDAAVA